MSVELTDLLIELSDPRRLMEFRRDPDAFLSPLSLAPDEDRALRGGSYVELRRHARSTTIQDPTQQFNRRKQVEILEFGPLEIDPQVHLDLNANDQIAISGLGLSFVDTNGVRYRAESNDEASDHQHFEEHER